MPYKSSARVARKLSGMARRVRCLLAALTFLAASTGAALAAVAATASAARPHAAVGTSATVGGVGALANDWPTFDYNPERSGVGPARTGITPANVRHLQRRTVQIPGTVDSAPIELSGVSIRGRRHDLVIATTSYGNTLAIDVANGRPLWHFFPSSARRLQGSTQITTATPVADPSGRYVYVATPDGFVHKLSVATGRQLWSTRVSWLPTHEKLAGSLNVADGELLVVTGGYYGDAPSYQGHVVTIDLASGRITHVWNALCSGIRHLIRRPDSCAGSDAAIWGRPGSVVEPDGEILVATGNGPFDGRSGWGDSVLELSPGLTLLHNWTPGNQQQLNQGDMDLGSTEPALLPASGGESLAVQGGKDGALRLLDLDRLDGTRGPAGPRTGGELQSIAAPGPTDVFSQPAVWRHGSSTYVFVSDADGTACYVLAARRLRQVWEDGAAGTSPVLAGGLLYVYDMAAGVLDVRNPLNGGLYASLPAAAGHWNSPIVIGGRIILPVGNDNAHQSSGVIYIYGLPGR